MPPILPSPLYVVLDVDALAQAALPPLAFLDACLEAGARVFQVRAKSGGAGACADLTRAVMRRTAGSGALVIVNDRVDVALVTGATGVHLGQEDLLLGVARAQLGEAAVIGLSTHTEAQVRAGLAEPASYLAIGPVFETSTKATGYEAVGLAMVACARALAGPARAIVAIGGITPSNASEVIRAGASAVAVIGGLVGPDPGSLVRRYLDSLS